MHREETEYRQATKRAAGRRATHTAHRKQGTCQRARAGRCYVCVKKNNVETVRARLATAHRLGANSNGRKKKKEDRWYPPFEQGKTSTADYVRAYQRLNSRIQFSDWKFSHADNIAPTYADGALDFDPVEEHEQDVEETVADLL